MPSVLITGANRGIGLGLVREYLESNDNWQVHASSRSESSELTAFAEKHGDQLVQHRLDVTDYAAIDALAATLGANALDLVISNAGVYSELQEFGEIDYSAWRRVLDVNTLAPAKLAEALAGCVKAGGKFAFMSSLMGSIADSTSGGGFIYRTTKAALNMVSKLVAAELKSRKIAVVTLHPGSVLTDMNAGGQITVKESATGLLKVIDRLTMAKSGSFCDWRGKELPW